MYLFLVLTVMGTNCLSFNVSDQPSALMKTAAVMKIPLVAAAAVVALMKAAASLAAVLALLRAALAS